MTFIVETTIGQKLHQFATHHRLAVIMVLGQSDNTPAQNQACERIIDGAGTDADAFLFVELANDMIYGYRDTIKLTNRISATDCMRLYRERKTTRLSRCQDDCKRLEDATAWVAVYIEM